MSVTPALLTLVDCAKCNDMGFCIDLDSGRSFPCECPEGDVQRSAFSELIAPEPKP